MHEHPLSADYQHEALPDPTTYIRLLSILQGDHKKPIECALTIWPLAAAPSYCAISYTWGSPAQLSTIFIDRKSMTVTRNCEIVLQQAYKFDPNAYYWVDAICIDQNNDEEKSPQVALMGKLYEQAFHVLACVGSHGDGSDFLMIFLEREDALIKAISNDLVITEDRGLGVSDGDWAGSSPFLAFKFRVQVKRYLTVSARIRKRVAATFMLFLQRPYFSRVWILQELYLGDGRITVCCGTDSRPLRAFLVLSMLVEAWIGIWGIAGVNVVAKTIDKLVMMVSHLPGVLRRLDVCFSMSDSFLELQPQRSLLSLNSGPNPCRTPLGPVLRVIGKFGCHDPKDRIFGALSLIDWPDHIPGPDYKKSRLELASEMLDILQTRRPSETNHWYYESLLGWADYLRELFQVPDKAFLKARPLPPPRKSGQPRYADCRWFGTQLHRPGTRKNDGSVYCGEPHSGYTEVMGGTSLVFAHAPEDTRPGDWFLRCATDVADLFSKTPWPERHDSDLTQQSWGLIIRMDSKGRYAFIGQTFPCGEDLPPVRCLSQKRFKIWWDPDDLLLFAWRHRIYLASYGPLEGFNDFAEWHKRHIYAAEMAFYARGPFEPEVVRKEIDAHERALGVILAGAHSNDDALQEPN